jgi:VIT1/CCC1 family predicted Fe2+/Mn2+ transporter
LTRDASLALTTVIGLECVRGPVVVYSDRIDVIVEQLPDQQPSQTRTVRVIHISLQLKTWFGKFIAGIIGVAVMLVAFFLSILAFAIIASIVVVAMIYFLWAARRARRTMRNQTADGILQSRDIQ